MTSLARVWVIGGDCGMKNIGSTFHGACPLWKGGILELF